MADVSSPDDSAYNQPVNITDDVYNINITRGDILEQWAEELRLLRPWLVVPLLLSLVAISLHTVAARVLWVVSVQCRFGHPTAGDLHQILLSVSGACLLQLGIFFVTTVDGMATGTVLGSYAVCVPGQSLETCSDILLRLLVVFLVLRVCLNRPMLRAHRIFIAVVGLLALILAVVHMIFASSDFCDGRGQDQSQVFIFQVSFAIFNVLLILISLPVLLVALCAVGMRRRRIVAAEFQSAVEMEVGMGGEVEAGVEAGVEGVEEVTSPGLVRHVENIGLAMGGVFCLSIIAIVSLALVGSALLSLHLMTVLVIGMSIEMVFYAVAGSLYLCMYPGFRQYVQKCFRRKP